MKSINIDILSTDVQDFINNNLEKDISKISLSKSPFSSITSAELATQIAAKIKAKKKLPTWYNRKDIYYPTPLSIEQTSSEITAAYKASLFSGKKLIDLTLGFGVDAFYFSKNFEVVKGFEQNQELAEITKLNTSKLDISNLKVIHGDGLKYITESLDKYTVIYVDPARRNNSGKVFKLADCTPNIVPDLENILSKTEKLVIKTSPLLDLKAGLSELKYVKEIHVVSVKNECKEVLWVLENNYRSLPTVHCATLNDSIKTFNFTMGAGTFSEKTEALNKIIYLYEPDAALLKSGAFKEIAHHYGLHKLNVDSHLYAGEEIKPEFPGRIFKVNKIIKAKDLKGTNNLSANVIVRNYPDTAEHLVKKYKIKPSKENFLLFTNLESTGLTIFEASIIQYY